MAHLTLDTEAAITLAEALRSYLSDLHTEISHTDTESFRELLKRRRATLSGILAQLQGQLPGEASGGLPAAGDPNQESPTR